MIFSTIEDLNSIYPDTFIFAVSISSIRSYAAQIRSMVLLKETTFAVTDIETTGRSPSHHRITEVAVLCVEDGEIVDERSTLINPEQYIPRGIQDMTGITNSMVLTAPKGGEVFQEIRRWYTSDSLFTAHNARFDFDFLQQSFARHKVTDLKGKTLCTLRLAKRLLPGKRGFGLGQLASYLGIKIKDRHRALGDAFATARILTMLLEIAEEEYGCETISDLLRFQYRPKTAFTKSQRNSSQPDRSAMNSGLPTRPGIYKMMGRGGELLYVGKAKNLRDRVGSYFRLGADHTPKIREMVRRVKRVEVEETGSELAALLRESKLIKEVQPKYNTAGKPLRRYGFLRLDLSAPFPKIEYAPEIVADGAEYYGPFRNRGAAEMLVETIDHLFKLRECRDSLTPDIGYSPCIYYQIKRCGAPCAMLQTRDHYLKEVEIVRAALSGGDASIITTLEERMQEHAEKLEFEEAASLRDRITELQRVFVWKRRFAESINSNNLIIMLPATPPERNELFLIRYGRLARQVTIGKRFPEETLRKHITNTYFKKRDEQPEFDRLEVEEVRLIAGYLRRRTEKGSLLYVDMNQNADALVKRVKDEVHRIRQ